MNNLIKFSQVNSILTIIMHLSTSKQISKPQLTTIAIPVQFLDTKLVFLKKISLVYVYLSSTVTNYIKIVTKVCFVYSELIHLTHFPVLSTNPWLAFSRKASPCLMIQGLTLFSIFCRKLQPFLTLNRLKESHP